MFCTDLQFASVRAEAEIKLSTKGISDRDSTGGKVVLSVRIRFLFWFTAVFSFLVPLHCFFIWKMNFNVVAMWEACVQFANPGLLTDNRHAA